tara:strand:+ start:965 stop:2545 length:1581 start_codon:yes stop_codon:yes gene_type:complete
MSELEGGKEKNEKKYEIRYEKINTIQIITNLNKRDEDGKRVKDDNINYDISLLIDLLKNYENKRKEYEKINEKTIKNKSFYDSKIDDIKDYKTFYVPVNFKLDEKLLKKNVYGFYAMFHKDIMNKLLENQKSKIINTDKSKNKNAVEEKIFLHNVKIYIDLLFIVNNLIKINNVNYTITKASYDKKNDIKKADILIKLNVSTHNKSTSDKKEKTCETRLDDIKQLYRGLYQGLVGIDVQLSPDEEEMKELDISISKTNVELFKDLQKIYESVFGEDKKDKKDNNKKLKDFTRPDIDINLTRDENVAMFRTNPKQYIEYIKLSNILSLKKKLDVPLNNEDRQLIIIDTLKKVKKEKERQKTLQKQVRKDLRTRLSSKSGGGKKGTQRRKLRRHIRRKRTRKHRDDVKKLRELSKKKRLSKRSIYHNNNNNNNNYINSIRNLIENNNILSNIIRNTKIMDQFTLENNNNNINEHDYILNNNNNGIIKKKKYTKKGCGKVIYKQLKNKATRRNLQKIKQLFNNRRLFQI